MMRISLHPPPPVSPAPDTARVTPVVLTEQEEALVRTCCRYQWMTVVDFRQSLAVVLGAAPSLSQVRKVSSRLAGGKDHTPGHFLYKFALPTTTGGNPPRVFVPGSDARAFLRQAGEEVGATWNKPSTMQGHSYSYIAHNLAVTRLAICAALFAREHQDYYLAETLMSHDMARNPPRVSLDPEGKEPASAVIPDLWVSLKRVDNDIGPALWLEVDNNANEAKTAFQRRLLARLNLIEDEAYAHYFGTPAVTICYAVLGKTKELRDARVRALRQWTAALLATEGRGYFASTFLFTPIEYETLYDHTESLFFDPIWQLPDEPNPVALLTPPKTEETPHGSEFPDQTLQSTPEDIFPMHGF